MTLAFFILAVAVAALLGWQSRRQKLEMEALCERLALPFPPPEQRVSRLEAVLTAYLGMLGLVFGGMGAWASILSSGVLSGGPEEAARLSEGPYQVLVVLVGGGAALLVMGLRALWHLRRVQDPASTH